MLCTLTCSNVLLLRVCLQAFTTDFRVHWAQHPLRPEFAESTYFLYKVSIADQQDVTAAIINF